MTIAMNLIKYKVKGFVFLSLLILIGLANTNIVEATVPVPSGFSPILSDTGVTVYRKNYSGGQPDFVTVVDLRYGTIRSFTGWVDANSAVERRPLQTFWNDAVGQNTSTRRAKVAINGTFFDPNGNPYAGIAFGLKADWWRMSYGYGLNEYPGLIRTFAFDSLFGSSSIQPYDVNTFDGGIPDVVGGLDPSANKSSSSFIGRTFVGVRDDDGNGHSETVIFFSSATASQSWAVNILNGFGAGSKMMLDGGSSTGLIVNGTQYLVPRTIPHAFIICAGR
jgi:hypothetical protein